MPTVSVIIAAYNSHETIAGCLDALRKQTFTDFECIVIDSGPSNRSQEIVQANFPEVRFFRIPKQLPPQAARDCGSFYARGELFVFTDPDIYATDNWLEKMVDAYDRFDSVIVGPIDCFGHEWLDIGIHLCKFYKCLPGVTSIDVSPTGNMLCSRALFEEFHGFSTNNPQGDVLMSWRLTDNGYRLHLIPDAIVYHHHIMTWRMFLKERYARGKGYAAMRINRERWNNVQLMVYCLLTVLPIRLASLMVKGALSALKAQRFGDYLWTLPVYIVGQATWLAGEARSYAEKVLEENS